MSKNVYDIFRAVQRKRANNYDTRSAAFIIEGKLAKTIFHKRRQKEIAAALVFRHDEGPDEVLVYSFIKDKLQKGDYFIFDDTNYLIYEENRLTDDGINHKKQRAVECNVAFQFQGSIYNGYFKSTLRRKSDPDFEGKQVLMPNEMPLLMLPTNDALTINSIFNIEGKPWKVVENDYITNKGITYYYLERDFTRNEEIEEDEAIEEEFVNEQETFEQTLEFQPMTFMSFGGEQVEVLEELALRPSIEYNFSTEEAYFSATPKVDVISRSKKNIKFEIPLGISQVSISTKKEGTIVEKIYKVVM